MTSVVDLEAGSTRRGLDQRGLDQRGPLWGLVVSLRPRQWVKNVLVVAAPFFAGRLFELQILRGVGVTFVVFCLIASGVYLINDVRDLDNDRSHPTKRFRPIAAGIIPPTVAVAAGIGLLCAGTALAALATTWELVIAVMTYIAISLAYCFFLKDQPVLDLSIISANFLIRAMAGGLATGIPISQWFLLVASFGALFIAAGKRYSEFVLVGEKAASTRRSLASYSASYLRFLWGTAASVTIVTYSLWAAEVAKRVGDNWSMVSVAPLTLGLFRYAMDIDMARAGTPEDIVFGDRVLQALGVVWLIFIVMGITT